MRSSSGSHTVTGGLAMPGRQSPAGPRHAAQQVQQRGGSRQECAARGPVLRLAIDGLQRLWIVQHCLVHLAAVQLAVQHGSAAGPSVASGCAQCPQCTTAELCNPHTHPAYPLAPKHDVALQDVKSLGDLVDASWHQQRHTIPAAIQEAAARPLQQRVELSSSCEAAMCFYGQRRRCTVQQRDLH